MTVHIRKTFHKRPARMMFAPLTREDADILHRNRGRNAMVMLSFNECERRYHIQTLPCPPQFEPLLEPPAVVALRAAITLFEASHAVVPKLPYGVYSVLAAARDVLRVYE